MKELLPNFTQIPNIILDDLMFDLKGSEIQVLFYICRRTYGFQKQRDNIAISQISTGIRNKDGVVLEKGTGLSNKTIISAINKLEEIGIIITKKTDGKTTNFLINTMFTSVKTPLVETQTNDDVPVEKVHTTYVETTQVPVEKVHTQNKEKESIQKKDIAKVKPLRVKKTRKPKKVTQPSKYTGYLYKQISDVFNLFKTFEITEDSARWFKIETQKDAIAELLKTKTFEEIEERLEIVKGYNQTPYISGFDKVYDPIALLKNWTKIEDKGKSIVNEKITKPKTIII